MGMENNRMWIALLFVISAASDDFDVLPSPGQACAQQLHYSHTKKIRRYDDV